MACRQTPTVPTKVTCAEGKRCLNVLVEYTAWLERSEARVRDGLPALSAADPAPKVPRDGRSYSINSALQNYSAGFLPCGHFCCPVAPARVAHAASGSADALLTCAQRHGLHRACTRRGKYVYADLLRMANEQGLLTASRPGRTNAALLPDMVYCPVPSGSAPTAVDEDPPSSPIIPPPPTVDVRDILAMPVDEVRLLCMVVLFSYCIIVTFCLLFLLCLMMCSWKYYRALMFGICAG